MKYVVVAIFACLLTLQLAGQADGRDRESCECRELRTIRQLLMGFGPPSLPPVPTPTGVPDGGPLE
jgi:hypothetical protein